MKKEYKNAICKGSYVFGTACGNCERCFDEREAMNKANKLPDGDAESKRFCDKRKLCLKLLKEIEEELGVGSIGAIVTEGNDTVDPKYMRSSDAHYGRMQSYATIARMTFEKMVEESHTTWDEEE